MRSVKETIDYLNDRIKRSGMTRVDVLKQAGLSVTIFTMALKRNSYLKLETFESLSKILDVPISDILGLSEKELTEDEEKMLHLPDDIKSMVDMLLKISPQSRKMIMMNIENYYSVEQQNKPAK